MNFVKTKDEFNFIHFDVIDSTNTFALTLISSFDHKEVHGANPCPQSPYPDSFTSGNGLPDFDDLNALNKTIITSNAQTNGRGRLGRAFYSPDKTGIYMSIIYVPQSPVTNPALLTVNAATAVCRSLAKLFNADPKIKWVNDIYINGKKVCGILTEGHFNYKTSSIDAAVIGIGINISTTEFPEGTLNAGSILSQNSLSCDNDSSDDIRQKIAKAVSYEYFDIMQTTENQQASFAEYKSRSFLIGSSVTVSPVIGQDKTNYTALVVDIDSNANLVVQKENGEQLSFSSGEVSLHNFNQ